MSEVTRETMIEALRVEIIILEAKVTTGPEHLAALRAALRELEAGGWRPISKAPKHDNPSYRALMWSPVYGHHLGHHIRKISEPAYEEWAAEGHSRAGTDTYTHWMPLPSPPTTSDGGGDA